MGCGSSNTEVIEPLRERENRPVEHAVARSLVENEDSGRSKSEPGRHRNLVGDRRVSEKNGSQPTHLRTNVTLVEHKDIGASQTDPHGRGNGDEHPPSSFKPHARGDNTNSPSAEIENTRIRTSLQQTKAAPSSKDEPPPGPETEAKGTRGKAPPTSAVLDGSGGEGHNHPSSSHESHAKLGEDPVPKPGTITSDSNLSSKPKPDTKIRNEDIPTVDFETGSTGHPQPHRNYNTSHLDVPLNGDNGKTLLSTVEPGSRDKNEQLSSSSKPDARHANNKNLPPTPQPNFKDDNRIDTNPHENYTQTKPGDKAIVRESVAKETEQSLRAGVEKAPSPAGETTLERVRREALEMHNVYRARHGVSPLVLNDKISQYSQKWAEKMAATQKFEHSPGSERPDYGENIYYSGSTNFKVENVKGGTSITAFYNEIKDYDFKKPGERKKNGGQIGHFTQVVWKNSKELGVGMATTTRGDMGLVYICCNYGPPGNYVGDFERNVLPPINSKERRTNSRGESEKATSQRTNNKKVNQEPPGRKETALQRVRREVLEEHNARRQKFGVAPLTLNSKINTFSQKRAEQMAKTRKFEQSPRKARPNYEESIFMAGSETFKLENVKGSEVSTVFCDGMEQNSNIASHFTHSWNSMSAGTTELAWKNSQQLGVGMATTKQGKIGYVYICCNYS